LRGFQSPPVAERGRKTRPIQQTVYLRQPFTTSWRELAFSERVKMHTLIMEGLDAVISARG